MTPDSPCLVKARSFLSALFPPSFKPRGKWGVCEVCVLCVWKKVWDGMSACEMCVRRASDVRLWKHHASTLLNHRACKPLACRSKSSKCYDILPSTGLYSTPSQITIREQCLTAPGTKTHTLTSGNHRRIIFQQQRRQHSEQTWITAARFNGSQFLRIWW